MPRYAHAPKTLRVTARKSAQAKKCHARDAVCYALHTYAALYAIMLVIDAATAPLLPCCRRYSNDEYVFSDTSHAAIAAYCAAFTLTPDILLDDDATLRHY